MRRGNLAWRRTLRGRKLHREENLQGGKALNLLAKEENYMENKLRVGKNIAKKENLARE